MDAMHAKMAIKMAVDEDEAFRKALEAASEIMISESEDGSIMLKAGDEEMEIDAETLMDAMEEERGSYPPPPPAPAQESA
jgi:hypothetical protein